MDLGDDMDEEMRAAIAMSMQMQGEGGGGSVSTGGADVDDLYASGNKGDAKPAAIDPDEEEALKLSLALAEQVNTEEKVKSALQDENYVKSLFGDLPVDLDNASIQAALQSITKGGEPSKDDDKKKKEDEDKKKKDSDESESKKSKK